MTIQLREFAPLLARPKRAGWIPTLFGDFVGTAGAAHEHVIDVEFVVEQFFAAFSHGRKIFPKLFEEVDSPELDRFDAEDEAGLRALAEIIAAKL